MRSRTLAMAVSLIAIGLCSLACEKPSDALAVRKAAWQDDLDQRTFSFSKYETGVMYSLSQFQGDCKIEMIFDPKKWWQSTFKLLRENKEIAAFTGDAGTVFRGEKGAFYVAQFSMASCGCRVVAFDTNTGVKLWDRQLSAAGEIPHSAYENRVIMNMAFSMPDSNSGAPSSLIITGSEGAGDYIEVLDAATGTVLAHRVYRSGF